MSHPCQQLFFFIFCFLFFINGVYGFNRNDTDECTSKYQTIIKDTCKTKHNSPYLCFNFNTTNEYSNHTWTEIVDALSLRCCEDACTLDTIISNYCCDEEKCFAICRKEMTKQKIRNIRKRKSPPLFRQILSSFMI